MKTLKEYLIESKKVYDFKVKVAGNLPEDFQSKLKTCLDRCKCIKMEKISTTPVQAQPLDFPTLSNVEVHIFEVTCEYPITSPEIASDLKAMGLQEDCFRVRGADEPSEQQTPVDEKTENTEVLLADPTAGNPKVNGKDYFGDDFNKSFLKDLQKAAKQRSKEGFQAEYKLTKQKVDKAGKESPISGSNKNPSPVTMGR